MATKYIHLNRVDFALEVQPHRLPETQKELDIFVKYGQDNLLALDALNKAYTAGTDGVAIDRQEAGLYAQKHQALQIKKAKQGDLESLDTVGHMFSVDDFKQILIIVPKTCNNAESLSFTHFDKEKEKAIDEWMGFTKQQCIPLWNRLHQEKSSAAPDLIRN